MDFRDWIVHLDGLLGSDRVCFHRSRRCKTLSCQESRRLLNFFVRLWEETVVVSLILIEKCSSRRIKARSRKHRDPETAYPTPRESPSQNINLASGHQLQP